ncbi:MAG: HPF/RaiA family ribosome-associated protein [Taibaiella sp.]|nr:HPF/RaiA family ribosome-associated protein [Taibaiella sp.]
MTIQINSDKNLAVHEAFGDKLKDTLSDKLSRFSEHITRLEVHLSDENGSKEGIHDKRCMIEARFEGRQPVAATNHAGTYDQAVDGAIDKIKAVLDSAIGRVKDHHRHQV